MSRGVPRTPKVGGPVVTIEPLSTADIEQGKQDAAALAEYHGDQVARQAEAQAAQLEAHRVSIAESKERAEAYNAQSQATPEGVPSEARNKVLGRVDLAGGDQRNAQEGKPETGTNMFMAYVPPPPEPEQPDDGESPIIHNGTVIEDVDGNPIRLSDVSKVFIEDNNHSNTPRQFVKVRTTDGHDELIRVIMNSPETAKAFRTKVVLAWSALLAQGKQNGEA
jgi:hypothetical protein